MNQCTEAWPPPHASRAHRYEPNLPHQHILKSTPCKLAKKKIDTLLQSFYPTPPFFVARFQPSCPIVWPKVLLFLSISPSPGPRLSSHRYCSLPCCQIEPTLLSR